LAGLQDIDGERVEKYSDLLEKGEVDTVIELR